jgi:cytochrome c biogenesis protein
MKSFREKTTEKSLGAMKHTAQIDQAALSDDVVGRYWQAQGFKTKEVKRDDGSVLIACKRGSGNKWGYIFAHAALIIICIGGLIDSNMALNFDLLTGRLVPDTKTEFAKDFKTESRLPVGTMSFRGNVEVREGQGAGVVFLQAGDGLVAQDLPFNIELKKFHVEHYETGMPKNFASDVVVIDKKTGKKQEATIKVNHPLTVDGISIYQASFGDGGSSIAFNAWDLKKNNPAAVELKAVSKSNYPLNYGNQQYQIEFGEFKLFNVEDMSPGLNEKTNNFGKTLHDARDVDNKKNLQNVGPTVTYRIRDTAGQAKEYFNYMLPLDRDGARYFATGEREQLADQYRWVMLPADEKDSLNTFMLLRSAFANPVLREKAIAKAVAGVDLQQKESFTIAVQNAMAIFSNGGYEALETFLKSNVPADQQNKMREFFVQIIQSGATYLLDEALLDAKEEAWVSSAEKQRFVSDSLIALTNLYKFDSPVLLQLNNFEEVQFSGLQLNKSPGQSLVYLGSVLLVLGSFCMFYIREKRAWCLIKNGKIRFAMSANRHARDLETEFPEHEARLKQLSEDLKQ